MNYLSVCSGIEAATMAWHPLGWSPVAFSEIEKFPSAVLSHRYPSVPNLGDMTKFEEWPDHAIDLLVGGTPCQSFSIAGLRKGLADARGNLMLTYLAIAARYRPTWLVWENVPGALSVDEGRAFASLIGGMAELGYHAAWRVLDAQYIRVDGYAGAVPQRRNRVFVVGHLGDWRRAAAVFLEPESLSGNPPPRREAGKGVAPTISARTTGGGGLGTDFDCDGGLVVDDAARCVTAGYAQRLDWETENFVATRDVAATITRGAESSGKGGYAGRRQEDDVNLVAFDTTQITSKANRSNPAPGDPCHPLQAGAHPPAVAFDMRGREGGAQFEGPHDTANIRAASGGSSRSYVAAQWAVRRLTPRECERLQGFPENRKKVIINICLGDKSQASASAEARCITEPSNAFHADESALPQDAMLAEKPSITRPHDPAPPVALHVLLDYELGVVEIRSHAKRLWSAKVAEKPSSSPLPMPVEGFVRLIALLMESAAQVTPDGRAASPANTQPSTVHASGSWFVSVSGDAIARHADGVEKSIAILNRSITSTTSLCGPDFQNSELSLTTLSSCVAAVIASSIPERIPQASSYAVVVEAVRGFTNIPWRGKPEAPDGPRYKALGNSMAVNAMRFIGQRIQMVEDMAPSQFRRAA